MLTANNQSGEKRRVHHHYLKGSVFCARCGSRLSRCQFKGNGGSYYYFFCLGRQSKRTNCDLPYLPESQVEAEVEDWWRTEIQMDEEKLAIIRANLLADLRLQQREAGKLLGDARRRITAIDDKRRVWAEKAVDGVIPDDIARTKQNDLVRQLVHAKSALMTLEAASADIEGDLNAALELIGNCGEAYEQADDNLRRQWNQAFFTHIEVDAERVTRAD